MRDNILFFGIRESVSKPIHTAFGTMGATGGPDDVIGGAMGSSAPMKGLSNADNSVGSTSHFFRWSKLVKVVRKREENNFLLNREIPLNSHFH